VPAIHNGEGEADSDARPGASQTVSRGTMQSGSCFGRWGYVRKSPNSSGSVVNSSSSTSLDESNEPGIDGEVEALLDEAGEGGAGKEGDIA
jgi:hypothetical protein